MTNKNQISAENLKCPKSNFNFSSYLSLAYKMKSREEYCERYKKSLFQLNSM